MRFLRSHWWNILIVLGTVVFILVAFRTPESVLYPAPAVIGETVELSLDFGETLRTWSDIPYVTGTTVFGILEERLHAENIPFVFDPSRGAGVFIRQIGDAKNGNRGRYWQYWVNGEYAMVAADRYHVQPKDNIEWKFTDEIPE